MKIKVQPAEEKTTLVPAYAFGSSPEGWSVLFDEGRVFLNMRDEKYISAKGFPMNLGQLETLIEDLIEFKNVVEELNEGTD